MHVNKVLITWLGYGIVYNDETWIMTSICDKKGLVKYILAYFQIMKYYTTIIML